MSVAYVRSIHCANYHEHMLALLAFVVQANLGSSESAPLFLMLVNFAVKVFQEDLVRSGW